MTGIQLQLRARSRCAVLAAVVVTFLGISTQPASAIIGGQLAAPGFFGYVTFVGAVTRRWNGLLLHGSTCDSERRPHGGALRSGRSRQPRSRSGQVVSISTTRARGRLLGSPASPSRPPGTRRRFVAMSLCSNLPSRRRHHRSRSRPQTMPVGRIVAARRSSSQAGVAPLRPGHPRTISTGST